VRLKGKKKETGKTSIAISIPSGAIKSFRTGKVFYYKPEFQFLLVRLKVKIFFTKFHFFHIISIPSGAIKRGKCYHASTNSANFNSFWCD